MNPDSPNETLAKWQGSAPYWDKYRVLITQMFAPVTAGLIEEAGIVAGRSVLDVGGGSGEPSLTLAEIVGPGGRVTYTDPAAGMVESAQAEAGRRGLANIEFQQCGADDLPFADNSFDVAVGRFSAMFFDDPLTGVSETLRVIRDRVSFAVWAAEEANPFFSTLNQVIERFAGSPEDDPDAPDAFRFAAPGKLAGILEKAGAQEVRERELGFQIAAEIGFEQFWTLRTEMSDSLRKTLAGVTAAERSGLQEAAAMATKDYFAGRRMSFPAKVLIVSGKKSARGPTEIG